MPGHGRDAGGAERRGNARGTPARGYVQVQIYVFDVKNDVYFVETDMTCFGVSEEGETVHDQMEGLFWGF